MRALFLVATVAVVVWVAKDRFSGHGHAATEVKTVLHDRRIDPVVEGIEARLYLNSLRQKAGLGAFYSNSELERAAAAHAAYLAMNGTEGHAELSSLPGFTGENPVQRAVAAGYSSRFVSENLSSGNLDFKDSVDGLFGAIYHRFGFLDPAMDEIGIAYAKDDGGRRIYVYDMGNYRINTLCRDDAFSGTGRYITGVCADKKRKIDYFRYEKALRMSERGSKEVTVWPYDGQVDVPPAFYEEIPDPLPEFSVSGYPISVIFNRAERGGVKITSFRLYDENSKEIPVFLMDEKSDPNHILEKNQFAIFPLERLEYATRYTASIHYVSKTKTQKMEWSFTTRSFDAPLLEVTSSEASFKIVPKKSYILYFKPAGPDDLIKKVSFPKGVMMEQIDPNTFRLEVGDTKVLPFDISASGRRAVFELERR